MKQFNLIQKMTKEKINELIENYINGNILYIREELKKDESLKQTFILSIIDDIFINEDDIRYNIKLLIRRFV